MTRAAVKPEMLRWACERSRTGRDELTAKFSRLPEWEAGDRQPTLKQLEAFADAVRVPVGYLFLPEPPEESLPIADFRTMAGRSAERPSPNLLDTIYLCQERQDWYREFARITREPERGFIGSASLRDPPSETAENIRSVLGFNLDARRECRTSDEALQMFIKCAEDAGILAMTSGVVANNNRRPLDLEEFRGFALTDKLAPLVFINGRDARAARMFTLAHELAHLWLGESALSNAGAAPLRRHRREEVWCNAVAAEILVPLAALRPELRKEESLEDALSRLRPMFKVSNLVILRRLLDAGRIDRAAFEEAWKTEMALLRKKAGRTKGGSFYNTVPARAGRRFVRALVTSTLEGQTLYRDAFRMLGISKTRTFHELGRGAGVI